MLSGAVTVSTAFLILCLTLRLWIASLVVMFRESNGCPVVEKASG